MHDRAAAPCNDLGKGEPRAQEMAANIHAHQLVECFQREFEHADIGKLSNLGWILLFYSTVIQFCVAYVAWFAALAAVALLAFRRSPRPAPLRRP